MVGREPETIKLQLVPPERPVPALSLVSDLDFKVSVCFVTVIFLYFNGQHGCVSVFTGNLLGWRKLFSPLW